VSIHHPCRSSCDQPDVFRAPSGAQDLTATKLAIGVTAARCVRINVAACNRSITIAGMLRDLLGPAFSQDCGATA
jgi:hypothetical protein